MTTDPSFLLPDTLLCSGKYRIGGEIGRGGFSVVYEALDTHSNLPLAIKLLVPPPAAARIAKERMRRESIAARTLHHPAIVKIFEFVEEGGRSYIVMERIFGNDLQQIIFSRKTLDVEAIVRIGTTVTEVLEEAHRNGILHRDIKPQNILLDTSGTARLTDFGSARIEGQSTLTHSGAFVGTLDYLAPEIIQGGRGDSRSDLYSLGLTLYFAATGRLPTKDSPHLPPSAKSDGYHPVELSSQLPQWLDQLIARATSADTSKRFSTAAEFAEAFRSRKTEVLQRPAFHFQQNCVLCRRPAVVGLIVCADCASRAEQENVWVVFSAENHRECRKILAENSVKIDEEVIGGKRPLVRLPLAEAEKVRAFFHRNRVHTERLKRSQLWRLFPLPFAFLVIGIVVAGFPAAAIWTPFRWMNPFIAFALCLWMTKVVQQPLIQAEPSSTFLPLELQEKVVSAISQISSSSARSLLADLTWLVEPFFRSAEEHHAVELKEQLRLTLESSAEAAQELDSLENVLNRMDNQRAQNSQLPQEWLDGEIRCEQARQKLVQRLLESIGALSMLHSDIANAPGGVAERLQKQTELMISELEIQTIVVRELNDLILTRE